MSKISFNFKIRSLQLFFHLIALWGIFFFVQNGFASNLQYLFLSLVAFWIIGTLGINVCLHRYLTHKSFECPRWFKLLTLTFANLSLVGTPLSWPAIHRWHHKHSDTDLDPHSPYTIGNFRSWIGLWRPVIIPTRISRDLIRDKDVLFFHRNYFSSILLIHLAVALVNPYVWVFGLVVPAVLCLHATSVISVFCHRFGYKNHPQEKTTYNNFLASIITLGEGWHNNHHAFPSRLKHGEKWWEFDIPYLIISIVKTDKK